MFSATGQPRLEGPKSRSNRAQEFLGEPEQRSGQKVAGGNARRTFALDSRSGPLVGELFPKEKK